MIIEFEHRQLLNIKHKLPHMDKLYLLCLYINSGTIRLKSVSPSMNQQNHELRASLRIRDLSAFDYRKCFIRAITSVQLFQESGCSSSFDYPLFLHEFGCLQLDEIRGKYEQKEKNYVVSRQTAKAKIDSYIAEQASVKMDAFLEQLKNL